MRQALTLTAFAFLSLPAMLHGEEDKPDAKTMKLILELGGELGYHADSGKWFVKIGYNYGRPIKLQRLHEIPRLEELDLSARVLNDHDAKHLARLTSLRRLYLGERANLTANGFAFLANLTRLEELDFGERRELNDEDVGHLTRLTSLRRLRLAGGKKLTAKGLAILTGLTRLEELMLSASTISDDALKQAQLPAQLRILELSFMPGLTNDGLKHLGHLKQLEHLQLSCVTLTGAGIHHLAALPKLSFLSVQSGGAKWKTVAGLAKLRQLRSLQLAIDVQPKALMALQNLTELEKLSLVGTDVVDEDLSYLVPMRSLWKLDLSGQYKISDQGMKHVGAVKSLRKLVVTGSHEISAKGLAELRSLPNLEELAFNSYAACRDLKRVVGLPIQSLTLTEPLLSKDDWRHLRSMTQLTEINLGSLILNEETWGQLQQLAQVESLTCRKRDVRESDLRFIKKMPKLRELDLSSQPITDRGLRVIAEMKQLTSLNLRGTYLTDDGIKVVGSLKNLEHLSIGGGGSREFKDGALERISGLKSLKELEVYGPHDFTAKGIAQLKSLKHLQILQIDAPANAIRDLRTALPKLCIVQEPTQSGFGIDLLADDEPSSASDDPSSPPDG